jgi:hypothetical protein
VPDRVSGRLSVNIGGKDVVAHFREHAAAAFFGFGQAGPLVDDEHGGALAGDRVVVNVEAFQGRAVLLIGDVFFHQGGVGGGDEGNQKGQSFHEADKSPGSYLSQPRFYRPIPWLRTNHAGFRCPSGPRS